MRTETKEITVYKFDELDESTQREVIENWRENDEFPWGAEWHASLDKFEAIAPIKVKDWDFGYNRIYMSLYWTKEDEISELSYTRAWKWLNNNGWFDDKLLSGNCPFTGYCGDESLLDHIRDFKAKPDKRTLKELFKDCLHKWLTDYENDYDYWQSEESIREDIEANDYEFTTEGKLYHG